MEDRNKFRILVKFKNGDTRLWVDHENIAISQKGEIVLERASGAYRLLDKEEEEIDTYTIQFCIGFKDKNDVLIYQGDNVKAGDYEGEVIRLRTGAYVFGKDYCHIIPNLKILEIIKNKED